MGMRVSVPGRTVTPPPLALFVPAQTPDRPLAGFARGTTDPRPDASAALPPKFSASIHLACKVKPKAFANREKGKPDCYSPLKSRK
jgi:hypothetical protein